MKYVLCCWHQGRICRQRWRQWQGRAGRPSQRRSSQVCVLGQAVGERECVCVREREGEILLFIGSLTGFSSGKPFCSYFYTCYIKRSHTKWSNTDKQKGARMYTDIRHTLTWSSSTREFPTLTPLAFKKVKTMPPPRTSLSTWKN